MLLFLLISSTLGWIICKRDKTSNFMFSKCQDGGRKYNLWGLSHCRQTLKSLVKNLTTIFEYLVSVKNKQRLMLIFWKKSKDLLSWSINKLSHFCLLDHIKFLFSFVLHHNFTSQNIKLFWQYALIMFSRTYIWFLSIHIFKKTY